MAGSSTVEPPPLTQARFYFDFASPQAYLAAEQVNSALGEVPEWVPVAIGPPAFRCQAEVDAYREDVERRARAVGMQPLRWPPGDLESSEFALLAATYAKSIGRAVAFSLAAFRQAYAGGRDLGVRENVLIAAAACEMHPTAVLKALELRSVSDGLARAVERAADAGVTELPAIQIGSEVFCGCDALQAAA
jgi:2-hydroxychromene-2-carboxylate isomerase